MIAAMVACACTGPHRGDPDPPGHQPIVHRAMELRDLDGVLNIEARAYSHPWSRGNFVDSLAAGYRMELCLDARGRCLGYSVAMPGVDEMHLLNLTVEPAWQRRGHGRSLLRRLVCACRQRGDRFLWLEVRAGNGPAQALYAAEGFVRAGVRKGYYPLSTGAREDAVVMRLAVDPAVAAADAALPRATPGAAPHAPTCAPQGADDALD